jgi:hypothetical protein
MGLRLNAGEKNSGASVGFWVSQLRASECYCQVPLTPLKRNYMI